MSCYPVMIHTGGPVQTASSTYTGIPCPSEKCFLQAEGSSHEAVDRSGSYQAADPLPQMYCSLWIAASGLRIMVSSRNTRDATTRRLWRSPGASRLNVSLITCSLHEQGKPTTEMWLPVARYPYPA